MLGEQFARALAAKDFDAVRELIHPEIDFRGITPRLTWEASNPDELITGVLRQWLEDSDEVDSLDAVESGVFADLERVTYRFSGRNGDGPFVAEQHAYLQERDGKIGWMRVMCSGFRTGSPR